MFETVRDSNGNKIVSESCKKGGYKFYLYLNGEQYRRLIGHFVLGTLHFVRNPDHVFQKTNSYGFNDNFVRKFEPETPVLVREKGTKIKLKTTIGQILDQGTYLHFMTQGFERQIFLCRSLFDKQI